MQDVKVFRIATHGPGDVSGLATLIEQGHVQADEIVAVMGKTEGNGCVNDYTREYATSALAALLGRHLGLEVPQVEQRVAFVMSGGTEGVLSPHITVFTRRRGAAGTAPAGQRPLKRLAIGVAFTRAFAPEEIGRMQQVHETATAVRDAMADAGVVDASDVHFVQIKCPLLSAAAMQEATARGHAPVTEDTYGSMAYSRGASALGVALALGEVAPDRLREDALLRDWTLYSQVASTSAGVELDRNVVIVLGMSTRSTSRYVVAHDVMRDAIDGAAAARALKCLDLHGAAVAERVVNVFAKAEASADGHVRGQRHTMLNDSDIHATRHARAAVGAVLAAVVGHTGIYVSGGAEHQGPSGGGPIAIIARC